MSFTQIFIEMHGLTRKHAMSKKRATTATVVMGHSSPLTIGRPVHTGTLAKFRKTSAGLSRLFQTLVDKE